MARKLIRDEGLERALRLFWRNGYNGTSMEMLTRELGVEKPSIYATFGNKRTLYLEALLHYRTSIVRQIAQFLASAPNPRAGIDRVVRFMMTSLYEPGVQEGCMATNAALELADHDPEVAAHVSTMLGEIGSLFEKCLLAGQKSGEVTTRVSAELLAAYLVNAIEGARVMEKTRPGKEKLEALAQFCLSALDPAVDASHEAMRT
jgi:TetR/AcrR family transcriptional regulator, transcriptional repressor for nem operon